MKTVEVGAVDPRVGTVEGGTAITVWGRGFTGDEDVWFGDVRAPAPEVVSSVEIRAVVPRGSGPGVVDVRVTGPNGADVLEAAFTYTPATKYPDLVLDPEALRRAGRRVLVFRDFTHEPPPRPEFRGFARVMSNDLNGDGFDDLFVVPAEDRVVIVFGQRGLPGEISEGETREWGTVIWGEPDTVTAKSADANDNGSIDLTDPVFLLNSLFSGGLPPPAPFPDCGVDPTRDDLTCAFKGCR